MKRAIIEYEENSFLYVDVIARDKNRHIQKALVINGDWIYERIETKEIHAKSEQDIANKIPFKFQREYQVKYSGLDYNRAIDKRGSLIRTLEK